MKTQLTHGQCRICGYCPGPEKEACTFEPLRWWDCDDGWKISTLCHQCWLDVKDERPKPDDYAYWTTNGACDVEATDLDPTLAL